MSNLSWLPDRWRAYLFFFIPNWSWQTWLLIGAVLLCAFILEEAHYRHLMLEAEEQSTKKPEQTFLVPIISLIVIAVCWVSSVVYQHMHRSIPQEGAAQSVATPQPAPSIASPSLPTGRVNVDKEKHKSGNRIIVQEDNGGQNNTNTQVGTSQAPIAIAPQGIANAAPNLGSQTVNNFGEVPDPPLVLADQQCFSISAALRPFKGQTVVISVSGSMVNDPFGKKLQGAIEGADLNVKYDAAYMLVVQGIGTPPPGLSFSFGKNRKDILYVMAQQFQKLGLVNKPIKAFDLGNGDDVADVFGVFVSPPK